MLCHINVIATEINIYLDKVNIPWVEEGHLPVVDTALVVEDIADTEHKAVDL